MTITLQLANVLKTSVEKLRKLEVENTELRSLLEGTIQNISEKLDADKNYNPFKPVTLHPQTVACNGKLVEFNNKESKANTLTALLELLGNSGNGSFRTQFTIDDSSKELYDNLFLETTAKNVPPYKNDEAFATIGHILQENVKRVLSLASLPDTCLQTIKLNRGEVGRVIVKDTTAPSVFTTADSTIVGRQSEQLYVYPPEFYAQAVAVISDRMLCQLPPSDLVLRMLEELSRLVITDLNCSFIQLVKTAQSISNLTISMPGGNFSSEVMARIRDTLPIADIKNTQATLLLHGTDFRRIAANTKDFLEYWTPPTSMEECSWGSLGKLRGLRLQQNPLAPPYRAVTNMFILGEPSAVGALTMRHDFQTRSISRYNQGIPELGWFGSRIQGMTITDCSSVAAVSFED